MGIKVVTGATLTCSFGLAPSVLNVTSQSKVMVEGKPLGTVKDSAPNVNIPPFGMCTSLANPQVASATAAALGVLTPQPCTMSAAFPWTVEQPKIMVCGIPCLCNSAKLTCMTGGGIITINNPGSAKVIV